MTFKQTVRKFRKDNKLTIQQAAAHLDVPYRTYQSWISTKQTFDPPNYRKEIILQRITNFKLAK